MDIPISTVDSINTTWKTVNELIDSIWINISANIYNVNGISCIGLVYYKNTSILGAFNLFQYLKKT